jgi:uncharacterized protein
MPHRRVLAWDAPNIDMTFSHLLGRRPGPNDRPDLRALLRWLEARREPGDEIEASIFINVPAERPQVLQGWVTFLTGVGFRVFAKPKRESTDDVDEAMVAYVRESASQAREIIVGSNDARRFVEPLRELAGNGLAVTVVGFAEYAGALSSTLGVTFVDLEDIPELVSVRLDRVRLDKLPPEGRWFEPKPGSGGGRLPDAAEEALKDLAEETA